MHEKISRIYKMYNNALTLYIYLRWLPTITSKNYETLNAFYFDNSIYPIYYDLSPHAHSQF